MSTTPTAGAQANPVVGRWPPRRVRDLVAIMTIACAAVFAGGDVASAHQWGEWHWHRGGGYVPIYVNNGCGSWANVCEAARADIHNRKHPVYLWTSSEHTDISMLAYNAGNTGWGGLAEMINYSYPHVTHAHATLNTYYNWSAADAQGVMCQEIAHTLGLDHAPTGDCMAKGYYSGATNYLGPNTSVGYSHPAYDLFLMYYTLK